MTGAREQLSPLILNQRLAAIIEGDIKDPGSDLPDFSVALMQVENILSVAARRNILYTVPRETDYGVEALDVARELEALFGFAPHLTNTGRQVIIGDILQYRFGAGLPNGHDPYKRIPIPEYVADLRRFEEGGLFNKENALEVELVAYRSLKRNSDTATRWVNPPRFLRPLGYNIEDMSDVLRHWASELVQNYKIVP